MERQEIGILLGTMVLSLLLIEWIVMGGLGIAVCLYVILYYSVAIGYAKKIGRQLSKDKMLLLIPIGLVTLCFGLYSNILLRFLNSVLLYALIMLQTSYMYEAEIYKRFSKLLLLDVLHTGLVVPLSNITSVAQIVKHHFSGEAKSKIKILLKVLLGGILSLPFMIVVGSLLISSDAAFEGLMNITMQNIFYNAGEVAAKVLLTVIVFFPMYGFFYGLKNKKRYFSGEEAPLAYQRIDSTIAFTFVTLLCFVYITYCFSQLAYFVSAFKMFLPGNFTFAEYARRGFFEFVPLSMINLGVITGLSYWTKDIATVTKERWQKGYIVFISIFTLFLISSAFSKIVMYIGRYGLTLLRVYTSWFLALMFVVYSIILLKIFIKKIHLTKALFISFIVMFLGLNFVNIDKLIAHHNVKLYMSQKEEHIDTNALYKLSPSAASEIIKLVEGDNKEIAMQVKDLLTHYHNESNEANMWQRFNLSAYRANKITDEYQ